MVRHSIQSCLQLLAIASALTLVPSLGAQRTDLNTEVRSATTVAAEVRDFAMPPFDRDRDQSEATYRAEYLLERNAALEVKATLIADLFRADPAYPEIERLLAQRWFILSSTLHRAAEALIEIEQTLKQKSLRPAITREAWYARAEAHIAIARTGQRGAASDANAAVSAFVESYPRDQRGAKLLATLANQFTTRPSRKKAIYERLILEYPDNPAAKYWAGKIRQIDSIGKPFQLSFTDAITGGEVSTKTLQGKIIVIDFWATWYSPSVAAIPQRKDLHAQYYSKGVEFISVSLDQPISQGGLERLQAVCDQNAITWPQFYQGNSWNSEFSVAWGIDAIPATFIIDRNGKLITTEAGSGTQLEEWLPLLTREWRAASH